MIFHPRRTGSTPPTGWTAPGPRHASWLLEQQQFLSLSSSSSCPRLSDHSAVVVATDAPSLSRQMTPSPHPSKLNKAPNHPRPPSELNIVQYLKTSVIRAYYSYYHPNMKVNKFCRFFSPWVVYHGNGWFSLSIMTMDGRGLFNILRQK